MAIRNIIDGSFTVGTTPPVIQNIIVPTTNTNPSVNVNLTFMLIGSECSLVIDSFSANTLSNVLFDMSNPSIAQFKPMSTIINSVVINNGDGKVWGYVNWNPATNVFSITTLSLGSDVIGFDDAQIINYIIN